MAREWKFYMLGRLICGDDCLSQVIRNGKPTDSFRYQIQAKDYNEGIKWGKVCAKEVFDTNNYYSYRKSDLAETSAGLFNTIIRLGRTDIDFLLNENFVKLRKDFKNFKSYTALALIKNIPLTSLRNFSHNELAEFLAGVFDSDGCIRPNSSSMFICLDSQTKTRKFPLAYKEIELFKLLESQNIVPRIINVTITHGTRLDLRKRAKKYFSEVKKLIENVYLKEEKSAIGVKINIHFSCNLLNSSNKLAWKFWVTKIVPKLIRKDKQIKISKFIKPRKAYLSFTKISKSLIEFCHDLAQIIDTNGRILIKRPKYPQCEIRIKISTLRKAKKYKNKIEKTLRCKVSILKEDNSYYLDFYISIKNQDLIKSFVLPKLSKYRERISRFINSLEIRNETYKQRLGWPNGKAYYKN